MNEYPCPGERVGVACPQKRGTKALANGTALPDHNPRNWGTLENPLESETGISLPLMDRDTDLWKQYLPHPSDIDGNQYLVLGHVGLQT